MRAGQLCAEPGELPAVGASVDAGQAAGRSRRPPLWLVLGAFGAVYLVWGSTYLGIRLAIDSMPPLLMAGSRFLLAGAILYLVMRLLGAPRPRFVHWRSAGAIGALLLLVGNGGVTWAQQTVPSSIAALMVAATPLWINLIEWLRPRGERPRRAVFAGIGLGFAGVALIVLSKGATGQSVVHPAGAALLLLAPLCWALGSIFSRHAAQSDSALLNIAMQMLCGGALMQALGLGLGEARDFHPAQITAASAWAFVYLTLIGSLVGFTAYVWLLQVSTPARVSTYAYVNPFIAVLLGRLVLHEPLPGSVLLAGACIIGAVMLITTARAARGNPGEPQAAARLPLLPRSPASPPDARLSSTRGGWR
jgi:drug/metabolite transporter (DMT)-like permease